MMSRRHGPRYHRARAIVLAFSMVVALAVPPPALADGTMSSMLRAMSTMLKMWDAYEKLNDLRSGNLGDGWDFGSSSPFSQQGSWFSGQDRSRRGRSFNMNGFWVSKSGERIFIENGRFVLQSRDGRLVKGMFQLRDGWMLAYLPEQGIRRRFQLRFRSDAFAARGEDGQELVFLRVPPEVLERQVNRRRTGEAGNVRMPGP